MQPEDLNLDLQVTQKKRVGMERTLLLQRRSRQIVEVWWPVILAENYAIPSFKEVRWIPPLLEELLTVTVARAEGVIFFGDVATSKLTMLQ